MRLSKQMKKVLICMIICVIALIAAFMLYYNCNIVFAESCWNVDDDFRDDSLIVVLNESVSQYRGVRNDIVELFYHNGVIFIEELMPLSEDLLNSDGSINTDKVPQLAEHYRKTPYRQILNLLFEYKSKENILSKIKLFESCSYVVCAQPVYNDKFECASLPNDERYNEQWAMSSIYDRGGIYAPESWDVIKSFNMTVRDVRVGIMDTGIGINDDISKNVDRRWAYNAFKDSTDEQYSYDMHGHGTMVSGIIGAISNNGIGIAGLCNNVDLIPIVIADSTGYRPSDIKNDNAQFCRAIGHAINNYIDILNMSSSGFGSRPLFIEAIRNYGGLFVWSAGNDGKNISLSNIPDNLIAVGARNKHFERSQWNKTSSSCYGKSVDIYAPGGGVGMTDLNKGIENILSTAMNQNYEFFNGTSAAAPHVAGVAALLLSVNPNMTGAELKQAIIDGSDMIEISTPDGKQQVRNLNAYGALHTAPEYKTSYYSEDSVIITGINGDVPKRLMIPATYQGKKVAAINNRAFDGYRFDSILVGDNIKTIGSDSFAGCSIKEIRFLRGSETLTIEKDAFKNNSSLEYVEISRTVDIKESAFEECSNLNMVYFTEDAVSIGNRAFYNCDKITDINIPSNITSIGASAFENCNGAEVLYISNGGDRLTIGEAAFKDCVNLSQVDLPNRVGLIGDYAFYGCTSLNNLTLHDMGFYSLTIGEYAFGNCTRLVDLSIPQRIIAINEGAFYNCVSVNSIYVCTRLDKNISIGDKAFFGCRSARSCYITNRITHIGNSAFEGCTGMKELYISSNLVDLTIGDRAYYGCTGIEELTLNSRIKSIGNSAFYGCSGITKLEFAPYGKWNTDIGEYAFAECLLIEDVVLPNGVNISRGMFKNCSSLTEIVLPDNISILPDEIFEGCDSLTEFTISEDITSIGDNAFDSCVKLGSINLSENNKLEVIGNYAFNGTAINVFTLPNSVTSIGNNAFAWCVKLTDFNISPDSSLVYVGNYAFDNTAISSINLPDSVSYLGSYAFNNCDYLSTFVVPASVMRICDYTFYNCQKLTEVIIPNSVTYIGRYAFCRCFGLARLNLPLALTFIDMGAFGNCKNLESIILPDSVKTIEQGAFELCLKLKTITIPKNVERIGWGAFGSCRALEQVKFAYGSKLKRIPSCLFQECRNLTSIDIPDSVTEIESSAFKYCPYISNVTFGEESRLEKIGAQAFAGLAIEKIVIPRGVWYIDALAFEGCSNLRNVYIANYDGVIDFPLIEWKYIDEWIGCDKWIEAGIFFGCERLENIYIYNPMLIYEYKYSGGPWNMYADKITLGAYDWALVVEDRYYDYYMIYPYMFKEIFYIHDMNDLYELDYRLSFDGEFNGVIFYMNNPEILNDAYLNISEDIPSVIIPRQQYDEQNFAYPVLKNDAYSLGFNIGCEYLQSWEPGYDDEYYYYDEWSVTGESDSEQFDIREFLADKEYFPIIAPEYYKYDINFAMGITNALGVPVHILTYKDDISENLTQWKETYDCVDFCKWIYVVDPINNDAVLENFFDRYSGEILSDLYFFGFDKQYLKDLDMSVKHRYLIGALNVVQDLAERRAVNEAWSFSDYIFDAYPQWQEAGLIIEEYDTMPLYDYIYTYLDWVYDSGDVPEFYMSNLTYERFDERINYYGNRHCLADVGNICYVEMTVERLYPPFITA